MLKTENFRTVMKVIRNNLYAIEDFVLSGEVCDFGVIVLGGHSEVVPVTHILVNLGVATRA